MKEKSDSTNDDDEFIKENFPMVWALEQIMLEEERSMETSDLRKDGKRHTKSE